MNEEQKKNGFVFYESWYEGAKVLNPKHRLLYLEAVIKFGLYGEETELKGTENALFLAIKPTIKFNKKQRSNGLQGGGTQGNSNAKKTTQKRPKNDPNLSIYINDKDIDKDIDKEPTKVGECENNLPPAREGFEDFELYGILHNVKLKPAHVRHLHETYGVEIADETIDDLSCKLADGSVNSADHYATLLSWLRWRRRTDTGSVPMSSKDSDPEEARLRSVWESCTEHEQQQYRDHNQGKDPMQVYREGKEANQ